MNFIEIFFYKPYTFHLNKYAIGFQQQIDVSVLAAIIIKMNNSGIFGIIFKRKTDDRDYLWTGSLNRYCSLN